VAQFEEIEDPYLRERRQDIEQVVERVMKALAGGSAAPEPPRSAEGADAEAALDAIRRLIADKFGEGE